MPVEVFIVWPACAVPLSCGSALFEGAVVVVAAAATAPVAAEVAVAEPLDVDSLAALAMAQEAILAGTRDAVSAATAAAATINRNLAEQYG